MATSVDEAVEAAERLGFPVALKAVGRDIVHKTEQKAVRLNLLTRLDVRFAAASLAESLGSVMEGFLVQRMMGGGTEMMVGAIDDPTFGHAVVCGSGGVLIEVIADSACRLHPITERDAEQMVNSLKGVRMLRGFRGNAPQDEAAFRDAIVRVSALLDICPEIQELDINPLLVLPCGVCALDARVRVAARVHD